MNEGETLIARGIVKLFFLFTDLEDLSRSKKGANMLGSFCLRKL